MYVIDVIPFAAGAPPGALSYRSTDALAPGTLVGIPLRKKRVRGIVVSCSSVREAKAQIKRADFSLSGSIEVLGAVPEPIQRAIQNIATYHAATLGSVYLQLLGALMAEEIPEEIAVGSGYTYKTTEAPYLVRIETYKAEIENAAGTTLLILPTLAELTRAKELLKEYKPVVLSGAAPAAQRANALRKALASPKLVLATPAYVAIPIPNLTLLILDRVSAGAYRFPKRPYIDTAVAARFVATERSIPLLYGDFPLPLEHRSPDASLNDTLGTISVLDVTKEEEKQGTTFKAVPDVLRTSVQETLAQGGRIAILCARRGYAPAVVCRTCGASVRDEQGRALALATQKGERVLRSSDGKTVREADAVCDVCGSWNLLPLGIGVERVCEELSAAFPDTPLIRFDTDAIRTPAMARKALEAFEAPGSIAVGTEFMLPWLSPEKPIELALVASADSLLALPFWRSRERFVRLVLTLRERAVHTCVATRRIDDTALSAAEDPSKDTFFTEERSLRKALGYPPYGTLITVATTGTSEQLRDAAERVQEIAGSNPMHALPERSISSGRMSRTWVLQLPEGVWPEESLSKKLSGLPPSFRVLIDPDSLQ